MTFLATTDVDAADATVVIFADTFSNNFEPEILHAARRVLTAAGHRVAVAWPNIGSAALCCGRTYLATGQVGKAKDAMVEGLGRVPREQRSSLWKALGDFYRVRQDDTSARAAY